MYAFWSCSIVRDLEPCLKNSLPLSRLAWLPSASRTELRLPEPVCLWGYQALTQNLATTEEWKWLQMLRAGKFKSSPAMWNPTFETLFLLVGKLITLQCWVRSLCFFQRKYKRELAFSASAEAAPTRCGSSALCFSFGPRFTPPSSDWHWLKGRLWPRCDLAEQRVWCYHGVPLSLEAPSLH